MKERYKRHKDLIILDGLDINNIIGLVSTWMFGLVGFCVWLIVALIDRYLKK